MEQHIDSRMVDRALFNAVIAYELADDVVAAQQARQRLEEFSPDSELLLELE